MRKRRFVWTTLALLIAVITACDLVSPAPEKEDASDEIPVGGVLSIAGARRLDYLDPAGMYSSTSWFLARGVFRTLVTFSAGTSPESDSVLVADLATDVGTSNRDATEWTFTLKSGVRFGPALGGEDIEGVTGAEITSFDIKYGIERLFLDSVPAGYPFHYDIIKGTEAFIAGEAEEIAGIKTPDARTITFTLTEPAGDWPARLAMPAASPVPESYAGQFDQARISNYNSHVVASGPYFVKEWTPEQTIKLERNPQWDPATDDVRSAYVDGLRWEFGYEPTEDTAPRLVTSKVDLVHGARPSDVSLESGFVERVTTGPSMCIRYIWLNTTITPFDDPIVRKALAFAIDRRNLLRFHGGAAAGAIATSILPPEVGGHLDPDEFNPFESKGMAGNIKRAKRVLATSNHASGYREPLKLVAESTFEGESIARSVVQDLKSIGFTNIKVKLVGVPELVTDYYGDPTKDVAIGTSGGWCRDYGDPSAFFDPLFDPFKLIGGESFNYSQLTNRPLKNAIRDAQKILPGPERVAAWEEVNRIATSSGAIIPWAWDNEEILHNKSLINVGFSPSLSQIDWVVAAIRR